MRTESALELAQDSIEDVLLKIVEFTRLRHQVITANISNAHNRTYIPKRLDCEEFAILMAHALKEYNHHERLCFSDGQTVRFCPGGSFNASVCPDNDALELRKRNVFIYLSKQRKSLLTNKINNQVALQLLEKKRSKADMIAG